MTFSENLLCPEHGIGLPELEPRIFSFNSPHGACPRCTGLGSQQEIDPELVIPDPTLSIGEGAIAPFPVGHNGYYEGIIQGLAEHYSIDLETPWQELSERERRPVSERHQGRAHPRQLPQPDGLPPLLHDRLRGRDQQPRAPLPRDRLRGLAREDRGVHEPAPVPGLPRRPAQARGAGGDRSAAGTSTSSPACR